MTRQLYLPNKYKVTLGQGSVGFCTVWSDPEFVLKQEPALLQSAAIIGTLYSREGVNVILRNLALNPDVDRLFLWGNGALSKTPFGQMGTEIINALWKNGFDSDYQVKGVRFKLHREFDLEVISLILKNVSLIDLSEKKIGEVVKEIDPANSRKKYMDLKEFPEHKLEEGQPFPSEKMGFVAREHKIIDAWTRVVDRVMRYGVVKETEYGNKQRELLGVQWVVESEDTNNPYFPDWPEELIKVTGANRQNIEKYYPEFMSAELPPETAYTYGQRLWAYKSNFSNASNNSKTSNGEEGEVNQVEKIIEHIKESMVTRRAVATVWNQFVDSDKTAKNPPCLVMIQVIQTDGKLHLLAVFRSHDIFKAAIPNAFGLRRLQEHIAKETGFEVGYLSITSNSAHIYEEDWDNATKLAKCAVWEHPVSLVYNENTDSDPRGMFLVRIENDKLIADFNSPDGLTLQTFEGQTAKQIFKKISQLDLLSRPDHYMDLAAELQKAEIARDLGIPYKQDPPLRLDLVKKNDKR